jgi:hypothetical protein
MSHHRNSITFPSDNISKFNTSTTRGDTLLTLLPTNGSDQKTPWRGKLRTFCEGLHIRDIGVGASGQKKNIEQGWFYESHGYPHGIIRFSHSVQGTPISTRQRVCLSPTDGLPLISKENQKNRIGGFNDQVQKAQHDAA